MKKDKMKEDNYLLYIILVVLIVLMLIKISKEHNEGFQNNDNNKNKKNNTNNKKNNTNNKNNNNNNYNNNNIEYNSNNKYTKFNETVLDKEDVNEQITWENKSLSQCKYECNEDDKCIGFSREKIGDNEKGKCFPKQKIGDCHSLRRGDPFQRDYAQGFDSYIKQSHNDTNLLTKCIGDAYTLNRKIHLSSYMDPDIYVSIFNNDIRFIKYKNKELEFQKNCIFEVVAGLEGTGTVSFIIIDNFQENYYLSANINTNTLVLVPIDKTKSSVKERSLASFELFDGLADPTKVSIRTFSTVGEHYFWIIEGMHTKEIKAIKNPSIKLITKDVINDRNKKEAATFNISDKGIKSKEAFVGKPFIHHNNQEIFSQYNKLHNFEQSNEAFSNTGGKNRQVDKFQDSIKKLPNHLKQKYFNREDFQSSKKQTPKYSASTNSVILIDVEGNKLMIPSGMNNINNIDLNNIVSKLDKIYRTDCPPAKFNVSDIEKLTLTDGSKLISDSKLPAEFYKNISDLNTAYKKYTKEGSTDNKQIRNILLNFKYFIDNPPPTLPLPQKELNNILSQLKDIYGKNCNPKKFNINEINTVLITNPEEISCRLYNYDYTIPGEFGEDNTLYEYENIINNMNMSMKQESDYNMGELVYMAKSLGIDTSNQSQSQLYDNIIVKTAYKEGIDLESKRIYLEKPDETYFEKLKTQINNKETNNEEYNKFEKYVNIIKNKYPDTEQTSEALDAIRKYEINELYGKINRDKYFVIKSMQIFNHNPRDKFNKRTENYNKTDYVSEKLRNLERTHVNDSTKESFGKFKKNKEIELEAYKQTVFEAETKLNAKRKKLEKDIEALGNTSSNYKLDKLSKDHFLMKKRLH